MNWPNLLARRPWSAALVLGFSMPLLSLPVNLGTGLLAYALLPATWFGKSAASQVGELGPWGFLTVGVLVMPFLETIVGQGAPIELLRRLRFPPPACVIASGAFFGSLHWLGGGLGHGLATWATGCLFALAYWLCRPAGFWASATSAYAAHATHNFLAWFVLRPLAGS
ncbi:MAG TPA: CPBP family glutamic-type intramembrane protease [Roseateles sp.]